MKQTTGQALKKVADNSLRTTVADVSVTATLTGVDTDTDMTAAQAATIVTDLTALATAVNAILASLEAAGIHAG